MDDFARVQVRHRKQHLSSESGSFGLVEPSILRDVLKEVTTATKLQDQVTRTCSLRLGCREDLDDMRVVGGSEGVELIHETPAVVLFAERNRLYGNGRALPCACRRKTLHRRPRSDVHHSECPLANLRL